MTPYTRISAWFPTLNKYFRWCFTWEFEDFKHKNRPFFSNFGHFWYPKRLVPKKDPFSLFSRTRMIYIQVEIQVPPPRILAMSSNKTTIRNKNKAAIGLMWIKCLTDTALTIVVLFEEIVWISSVFVLNKMFLRYFRPPYLDHFILQLTIIIYIHANT